MMVGNDYVESIVPGPVEWFVRSNATVDTDRQLVAVSRGSLKRCLLNSVTFSEAMRHMKSSARAQKIQSPQQQSGSRRAIHIVIAINKDGFSSIDGSQQARNGLAHAEH